MSAGFPEHGVSRERILAAMADARAQDVRWRAGRVFSLVFYAGDEVTGLARDAYALFFSENGLNPTAFPSLRRFETDVVAMVGALLGGSTNTRGNMTSGGTESILLAVKAARDYARAKRPKVSTPEMVLPATAHPAFDKAAHYFDVRTVRVPVGASLEADPDAMRRAMTRNTILLVGSAPQYPHGVVDPIAALGELAKEHDVPLHVDACVGGMMLPFVRELGYPVPPFDLSVPGVTSLSVDLHKYGYAAKGASVLLFNQPALHREMLFVSTDWAGGIYASPTMLGTRPGGAIAAAWAVLNYLGADGYRALAGEVMRTVEKIRAAVATLDDVYILGAPPMSVMALASRRLDIYAVGDELTRRGWHLDRQQFPPSLHMTVNYAHVASADEFVRDLAEAVAAVKRVTAGRAVERALVAAASTAARVLPPEWVSALTRRISTRLGGSAPASAQRSAPMYGILGSLPNRGDVRELALDLVEGFTRETMDDEPPTGASSI